MTPFKHPLSAAPVFALVPGVKETDLIDLLSAKLGHLSALLKPTIGESGYAFRVHAEEIQDNYFWGCSVLADECRELLRHLGG